MSCEFKYPKELVVGDLVYKDWPMTFGISIVLEITQNKTHPIDTDISSYFSKHNSDPKNP